jgi:hypothetical protein
MSETVAVARRSATVCAPPNNNNRDDHEDDNDHEEEDAGDEKGAADDAKSDDHPHAETQSLLRHSLYNGLMQTPGLALRLLSWFMPTSCLCCAGDGGHPGSGLMKGSRVGLADLKVHRDNLLKLERHIKDVEREVKELQGHFDRSADALEQAAKSKRPYTEQASLASSVKHYKLLLERKHKTKQTLTEAQQALQLFIEETKDDIRQADVVQNATTMMHQLETLGDRAEKVKDALNEVANIAADRAALDQTEVTENDQNVLEAMLRHIYTSKNDKRLDVIQDAVMDADAVIKRAEFPRVPNHKPVVSAGAPNLLALLDE